LATAINRRRATGSAGNGSGAAPEGAERSVTSMTDHRDDSPTLLGRREFLGRVASLSALAAMGIPFRLEGGTLVVPNSEGYLLVDTKKCQGCGTCMMSCALAHTGVASYTLARIQVVQDSFLDWPDDISMWACRQCENAPCVQVCPTGANHAEPKFGNVRMVDQEKCIGCKLCIARCPYTPARLQWNAPARKSQKCDLCADTPYLGEKGGPGGTQTCVRVCPLNAITFTPKMPDQMSEEAYFANLRGKAWKRLGMSTD
jgi:protein NrfC